MASRSNGRGPTKAGARRAEARANLRPEGDHSTEGAATSAGPTCNMASRFRRTVPSGFKCQFFRVSAFQLFEAELPLSFKNVFATGTRALARVCQFFN